MTYDELTPMQRAMFVQAVMNWVGDEARTEAKGGSGARAEADREARELYEIDGSRSWSVRLGDMPLGTFSVTESKPTPERRDTVLDLVDAEAFQRWACNSIEGVDMVRSYVFGVAGDGFARWCVDQGVLPDGVAMREVVTPARPAGYKGTMVRVSKELRERMALGNPVAGLLDG